MTFTFKYSDPLLSTLLNHLWQRLQPQDPTSLAHLYLGSFSPSSRQILSISVRLDRERCCTAIFRPVQICSIGFKSGLWLGHSKTFRDLSRSHFCVVLAVCPVWDPEHSGAGFHQGSLCTLLRSSFPRFWLVSQSLPLKTIRSIGNCKVDECKNTYKNIRI